MTFDAVEMFDILEHVTFPKEILDHVYKLLNSGGVICLYESNNDSASKVLTGEDAHFIWPSRHLTFLYTPRTL